MIGDCDLLVSLGGRHLPTHDFLLLISKSENNFEQWARRRAGREQAVCAGRGVQRGAPSVAWSPRVAAPVPFAVTPSFPPRAPGLRVVTILTALSSSSLVSPPPSPPREREERGPDLNVRAPTCEHTHADTHTRPADVSLRGPEAVKVVRLSATPLPPPAWSS